jgi:hypothetical protein
MSDQQQTGKVDPKLLEEINELTKRQQQELSDLVASGDFLKMLTGITTTVFMKQFIKLFIELPNDSRSLAIRFINETHNTIEDVIARHKAQQEANESV